MQKLRFPDMREDNVCLHMDFDPSVYGREVAGILGLDGGGARLLPLVIAGPALDAASKALCGASASELFPSARAPEAALAGLWLYVGGFQESHSIAQDILTHDGSYWHGILHRAEPDAANAAYWFRRVGRHPVFPLLKGAADKIISEFATRPGLKLGSAWDPFGFIDFCETVRRRPGSEDELAARRIALAEWQLLFHHCATAHV